MGIFNWAASLFQRAQRPMDSGEIEKAFGKEAAANGAMKQSIKLWYDLYTNNPPWEDRGHIRPLGLPGAIGRELARFTLAEFHMTVSGGERAEYIDRRIQPLIPNLLKDLELGLCVGGFALRPYLDRSGQVMVDCTSATAFSPIEFDGMGRAVSGVFREVVRYNKQTYCRMEYHGFEQTDGRAVYVIRNKAYKGETASGAEVSLNVVPQWADIAPETRIENIDRPLFAYFKPPTANDIDPDSQVGVSVYSGKHNMALFEQADKQWEQIFWEFESGQRRIFSEASKLSRDQISDRLFFTGAFTSDGDLFHEFSPDFRSDPLYSGFQWILQRLEYNVGLSFGTISDPQSVEKTATEILAAKNRQRITVKGIQTALEAALDGLVYAINVYCDLYGLAPAGEYETNYNWGDGVLDDPETVRQDKAMMLQEISAGITNPWEYRVAFKKESEEDAKAMLPKMEDMVTENQEEIE